VPGPPRPAPTPEPTSAPTHTPTHTPSADPAVPDAEAEPEADPQRSTPHLLAPIPTSSNAYVVRSALVVLSLLAIALVVQLVWITSLEHHSAQVSLYNQLRTELALGTAPIGPTDSHHRALALGTPIAVMTIPSLGLKQTVSEGTTSAVTATGPGHLRNTVFPGGAGTSVVMGRAASYGGPFGQIDTLKKGAVIHVTTGVGASTFRVVDIRHAGAVAHPVAAGKSRLTLGTASGPAYVPSGVVWVDADKVGKPLASDSPVVSSVPPNEVALGTDTSTLWALFFWLEMFGAVLVGAVWTWRRRGHAQAWIVFTAPLLITWILMANQITRLLPNLL
jgi:LPXTG-site transpeptidase (sortase) family protein